VSSSIQSSSANPSPTTESNLARLWRDQAQLDKLRKLLAPIYEWFTDGFDLADLIEAKTLTYELG